MRVENPGGREVNSGLIKWDAPIYLASKNLEQRKARSEKGRYQSYKINIFRNFNRLEESNQKNIILEQGWFYQETLIG